MHDDTQRPAEQPQQSSVADFPVPLNRTLRRASTAPIAKPGYISSITPQQRQHLDNLAPSNLARKPKHTRFPFVKIKRSLQANGDNDGVKRDSAVQGSADESTPLLRS